jgi:hypothetical protein
MAGSHGSSPSRRTAGGHAGEHDARVAESRLRRLLGCLSRPELGNGDVRRLRRVISHPDWTPVPRIPSVNILEPLYSHHLSRAGISWSAVFRESDGPLLAQPSYVELMRVWSQGNSEIRTLCARFEASRIPRVMLFKGAAIAPLYESPALRQMVDMDFVVSSMDLEEVRSVLDSAGWQRIRTAFSETWTRRGNLLKIDLHVPSDALAQRILRDAVPATAVIPDARVLSVPEPTDHLILLALHAADNGGNRIWRDVCDSHALFALGRMESGRLNARGARVLWRPSRRSLRFWRVGAGGGSCQRCHNPPKAGAFCGSSKKPPSKPPPPSRSNSWAVCWWMRPCASSPA